jgi:mono/diheme cytochrome c family protein
MRRAIGCFATIMLAGISSCLAQQESTQEKPKETPPATAEPAAKSTGAGKKNPVAPTPEALAASKKFFGYDCAMCHGPSGDGKGDMVESMKLTMKDWRDPASLEGMSDGEIYEVITKGKGKMTGEGDRMTPDQVWKMVNYVRALAKKGGAAPAEAPKQ